MVGNSITVAPFNVNSFGALLTAASRAQRASVDQVRYLAKYAKSLGARTVVQEDHYIDRHFLDEYALYYCRTLAPPPNFVRRFHLFARRFSEEEFSKSLRRRAELGEADAESMERELAADYLGFVSIRPIPSAPVGRTVLRKLNDGAVRDIWATGRYEVHLANLTLSVDGIAFQQQDVAVGACATAALWSAMSRVTRREGMRAPTPAEVSQAAGRHLLPLGRTLPAVAGLTLEQLAEATRTCGFAPEAVKAKGLPEYFVAALHAYLLSGIPVVLALRNATGGHAVTAVGFQMDKTPKPELSATIPLRSAFIEKIYIHDDRIGPYARSFLRPVPVSKMFPGGGLVLELETDRESSTTKEKWLIDSALVPIYPKLRLPVRSLLKLAELLFDVMEDMVRPDEATKLSAEVYFERSGTYLSKIDGRTANDIAAFLRTVSLSRWCGVVRWFLRDEPLVEFVYDTTDVLRARARGTELLRAVVPLSQSYRQELADIAHYYGVPIA